MRVIAGSARGRRIDAPPGTATRPTTDRVREAMFNALGSLGAVVDARVLDGFAGSGALGIEALSRGAAHCTFVERDAKACRVIEANLDRAGLAAQARVVVGALATHLAGSHDRYGLVVLDPPHDLATWPDLLETLSTRLEQGAIVVAESDRAIVGQGDGEPWLVLREKRYGGTVVQVLSPRPLPSA